MHANCGKWDLTLHLRKHNGKEQKCDYEGCKFTTATKKQLKENDIVMTFLMSTRFVTKAFTIGSGLKCHRVQGTQRQIICN